MEELELGGDRRAELGDGEMRGRERKTSVHLGARELLDWFGHLTNAHS